MGVVMIILFKCNKFFSRTRMLALWVLALINFLPNYSTTITSMPWTWTYKKCIEPLANAHTVEYIQSTQKFNQLILSWNAERPHKGHFTFWGQLRDAQTQQWLTKHKLMAWGDGIQQSFASVKARDSKNHYVRLEMPEMYFADAFTIEVQAHDGASLGLIKQLFVNVSNQTLFKPETAVESLKSVQVKGVPQYSQMILNNPRAAHMCSPTSTTMLVEFCLQKKLDPLTFALQVYDAGLDTYGSWPFNMAHANELAIGAWNFYVTRLSSFRELHTLLEANIPVVVSVRGPLAGSASAYAAGHLILVVGYDAVQKKVLCHDPAFSTNNDTCVSYDYKDFLIAWERSRRLSYKAERGVKR